MEDLKRQESLKAQDQAKQRGARDHRKRQLKRITDMLDAYYAHRAEQHQKAEDAKRKREKYKGKTAEEIKAMKVNEKLIKQKEEAAKVKAESAKKSIKQRP